MSSNKLAPITIRTDDHILKAKLQRIARLEGRSVSKQAEQMIIKGVHDYEKEKGEIKIK